MIFIYSFVLFYCILGNKYTEASLLNPFASIFVQPPNANNIPGKVINTFLSPFHLDPNEVKAPEDVNYNEESNQDNVKAWWNTETTPSLPMIHNIFSEPSTTPDYDKIVAEKFPGAVNLLEQLKELNKLKEQQKQQQEGSGIKQTPKPGFGDQTKKPVDIDKGVTKTTTEKPKTEGIKRMKSITKRHFYFQAQPVKPKGEDNRCSETIYYIDD